MRSQKRITGNQPLDLGQFEQPNNLIIVELTFLQGSDIKYCTVFTVVWLMTL